MCLGILHTLLVALPKALDHVNDPLLSKIRDDFHYFILVSQNEVTAFRRLQKTIHICESTSIPNFQITFFFWIFPRRVEGISENLW